MADRTIRVRRMASVTNDAPAPRSASDRLKMMWQLTLDAWDFKGARPPRRIDLLTSIDGVGFDDASEQDLADVARLETEAPPST